MLRTITLCSGKGGVGKTLLAISLARVIQQDQECPVLLIDLDLAVRGLTLLAYQNKHALDQVPVALLDYVTDNTNGGPDVFEALRTHLFPAREDAQRSLYQRLENIFILPASTESERPEWMQTARLELPQAVEKLKHLQAFVRDSLTKGYLIFDTQAGLGSLSLAATTLSDLNLVVLEEDDISWRTALTVFLEITDLNRRCQGRSRSYFLVNKVSARLSDVAGKLKAFSFFPPVPYDGWLQQLVAQTTAAVLEREFTTSNFYRQVRARVWKEIATTLGLADSPPPPRGPLQTWWRT